MVRRVIFVGEMGAKFVSLAICKEQCGGLQRDEQEVVHGDRKVTPC